MQAPSPAVTWIKVDPPSFDLWGVLAASLGITGILAGAAVVLGALLGFWRIRRRRQAEQEAERLQLHLESASRP